MNSVVRGYRRINLSASNVKLRMKVNEPENFKNSTFFFRDISKELEIWDVCLIYLTGCFISKKKSYQNLN